MPLVKSLGGGIFEIRSKSQEIPQADKRRMNMINAKCIGSDLDDFLEEEGILEEAETIAIKRIITFEIEQEIKRRKINKTELAEILQTSRAAVNRILDPEYTSISLLTIEKIAKFLGKRVKIYFA